MFMADSEFWSEAWNGESADGLQAGEEKQLKAGVKAVRQGHYVQLQRDDKKNHHGTSLPVLNKVE